MWVDERELEVDRRVRIRQALYKIFDESDETCEQTFLIFIPPPARTIAQLISVIAMRHRHLHHLPRMRYHLPVCGATTSYIQVGDVGDGTDCCKGDEGVKGMIVIS